MATKIPVTVITGFLGSGKTSIIRHLLQNNQGRRIAVLVNEFGELGIDGELLKSCQICPEDETASNPETNIFELTNGCLCCTVQEEFYPTMRELIKRRDSIDYIIIETSGLALPKPLIKAFRWQEIRNAATVDAVITVVDCAAVAAGTFASDLDAIAAQRQEDDSLEHETPLQELFEDQLACADLVILNDGCAYCAPFDLKYFSRAPRMAFSSSSSFALTSRSSSASPTCAPRRNSLPSPPTLRRWA